MNTQNDIGTTTLPRAETIARLNDALRKTGQGGTILVTRGVLALKGFDKFALIAALASYDSFDADNDPHGERDFGDLQIFEAELLWKLDYYDKSLEFGSDDPAHAEFTSRVLTVMLASEY
jgi:Protein of unknown function (DUF3768)